MTVAEIKKLAPLAEAYELKAEAKYIITIPFGEDIQSLLDAGPNLGINGVICCFHNPGEVRFYQLG